MAWFKLWGAIIFLFLFPHAYTHHFLSFLSLPFKCVASMYDPNHTVRREERKFLAEQPGRRILLLKVFIPLTAAMKLLRWLCKSLPLLHCSPG